MKFKFIICICAITLSTPVFAQQQTEEQCKKQVEASISALELMEAQKGTEQKLGDLGIKEIREIQSFKGSCRALQEINKRVMK